MITIQGLNKKQVAMLNIIWSFEDHYSFTIWFESLPYSDKLTVESLLLLMKYEMLEDAVELFQEDAQIALSKFSKGIK
jgi:hypothetical protein